MMLRKFCVFSFAVIAMTVLATAAQARPAPDGFADLAERLSPSVVNISTAQTVEIDPNAPKYPEGSPLERFNDFFGSGPEGGRVSKSLGSGFVIDKEGYIVTNNHVIDGADVIETTFPNGETYTAKLIGRDPSTDIAVLKIDAGKDLPAVSFANGDEGRVGDWVIAIGNPFGYSGSVAAGIISARNRNINQGSYDDFIQTDVAINKGNSGGPLFNMDGEVIGVNTAIISPTGGSVGISFSISADLAKSVVKQLREYGETRRGTLGVRVQVVDKAIAQKSYGLKEATGALVTRVKKDSAADKGGLKRGDLIVSIGGEAVENSRTLFRLIAESEIDKPVDIEYIRKKKRKTVSVVIERLEEKVKAGGNVDDEDEVAAEGSAMGISIEALSKEVRRKHKIKAEVKGVRVVKVNSRSMASGKITPGDIIEEVNHEAVTSPESFEDAIEALKTSGQDTALILVNQRGNYKFYAIDL